MCKPNGKILFCTCTDEKNGTQSNEQQESIEKETSLTENPISYRWILSKSDGPREHRIMGSFMRPSIMFDEVLSAQFILHQLNTQNCFDFDYVPSENDKLTILADSKDKMFEYMSFMFNEGEWERYNFGFQNEYTPKSSGELKVFGDCSESPLSPTLPPKKTNFFTKFFNKIIGKKSK